MARNILICHIMHDKKKEVGTAKTKIYNKDFTWNKRLFTINHEKIITDKKGVSHIYIDVQDTSGVLSFDLGKDHTDKCVKCGDSISIDSQNARDTLKRKTISAIWGIDNSYVMLLLIMGIVLIALVGALFFVIGELNKTNTTLQKYLPAPSSGSTASSARLILPFVNGGIYN